ncbi:SDR family oxidoreductase [Pedobacter deserti]|uniref:SDR family oxidoreductase n=1 Tax=Pedobacter deserti TaxID=2817382 RepID=UPI00210C0D87|nr:SDR family oxidoreductase [Pedobacter sp. SYSU D00382]
MENLKDYLPENLKGKRILISGGTTGIGRATAILLASVGARVMIFGRSPEPLEETLQEIRSLEGAGECFGITADVAHSDEIERIFSEADSQLGGLDIMINNAALAFQGISDGNYSDWQYIVQTNLLGYMACAHEAIKRLEANGGGHIVNIGSMSADVREEGSSVYVATKSAIQGFSEALRKEVNKKGIKVTLIEPGAVGTDMQPSSAEEQRENIEKLEMLKAEDIAMSVLYCLAQPKRCDVVDLKIRPHLQII